MSTRLRLLLGLSLLSNAALAFIVAAGSEETHAIREDTAVSDRMAAGAAFGTTTDDFGSKENTLRRIESDALVNARRTADRYWSSAGDYLLDYSEAVQAARDTVRARLTDVFGSEVREDPLFRTYFRPMDPMFHFLSSNQQLAIEQLKFERDRQLQAAMSADQRRPAAFAGGSPISPGTVQEISQSYDEALAGLLDTEQLLEFRLRESATAEQLRSSGVEFTEPEFRDAYRLMARLAGDASALEQVIEVRDGLRDLLGSRRFALLWSSRDPVWFRVRDLLEKNGVDERSADAVYQVINDFQDRKMRAALQAEASGGSPPADFDLADQERDAIARIVGEQLADEVIRSRALETFRTFRSLSQPGDN